MSKLGSLMDVGRRSMQNSQTGLRTVAHNIANRSTEGYSRQRVDLQHNPPVGDLGKRVGTGARVANIESIRNNYLEKQIEQETQKLGFQNSSADGLVRVEQIYNEQANKGLNRFVAEFFNGFRELTNSPESVAVRTLVKEAASALTEDFQRIHNQLRDVQKDLDFQIKAEVTEINGMTEEIADLNSKISAVEMQGAPANDERDRRNLLLKQLGEKLNIKYAENEEGIVTVMAGQTGVLVSGFEAMKLSVQASHGKNSRPGSSEIFFHPSETLTPVNLTKQITGGKIGGALDVRDRVIEGLLDKNDALAFTIATEVNKAHIEGVDRYSKPGVLFFDLLTDQKDAAANIKLNAQIQKDVGRIAAGYEVGGPGDNRVAHKIAGIQFQSVMSNNSANIDDFYNSMVGEVAVFTKQTNMRREHHDNIVKQLGNIRESISGVSLDEETTKMIEMQKAFDASARVIRTADELFDTVLNLKRY